MEVHHVTNLRRLARAIESARMVDSTMPVQTLAAFLVIAAEEGQTITAIGNKVGIPSSSATRNVSALSDWDWKKKVGLKLVEYRQDPMNLSVKNVFLTKKGQHLAEQMAVAIGGKP